MVKVHANSLALALAALLKDIRQLEEFISSPKNDPAAIGTLLKNIKGTRLRAFQV
ncbi:MAG TPA: hypothetical protein VKE98_24065 [Gemmataceae bacterium]|nr:hypothetical protein [Gemmataceae bacterium]